MDNSLEEQITVLKEAIATQRELRSVLGDDSVDTTLRVLKQQLARLEATCAPEQPTEPVHERKQRKHVTVMFADLPGFTAASETMDAEDVGEMMNALWERLDVIITSHNGSIDKHIGDSVMALWGAQVAREDDPEQAVRAALAMQATIQELSTDTFHSLPLQMRIGLHTGPVLLGQIGTTGEYTAIGDTVNTASRLEEAAPAGGILISRDTYRHVRGVFRVEVPDPITVKGKKDPIPVYLILEAKPRAFRMGTRGVEGIETRLIGRDAELQKLQDTFYAIIEQDRRHVVTILGETGIGKSRLLYEFDHWIDLVPERLRYFKSRAHPTSQNLPYGLLRSLFSFRFQIRDSDAPAIARQKMVEGFRQTLGPTGKAEKHAHFVGHQLGLDFSDSPYLRDELDDPQGFREHALDCLVDYFGTMTAADPVVILLEDMHWADESSMDAFSHLARALPDRPLLVVCTARPSIFERYPQWCAAQGEYEQITLSPLSKRHSRRLVDEILQKVEAIPDALREMVVGNAEGNPFYIEELIKMLIEEGVIVKCENVGTPWRIEPTRLVATHVPATLTGILQARLDSLAPGEREVLQRASIAGRIFWKDMIAFLDDVPSAAIADPLEALEAREMIFRRRDSAFAQTHEYIFKNILLCQVTYESVLKHDRRTYHARAAEWLIAHIGERAIEYAAPIADHLQKADQIDRAIDYLDHAGHQALQISAYPEAHTFFEQAMELAPDQSHRQIALAIQAARTVLYLGDYDRARQRLQQSLSVARQQGDVKNSAAALNYLGEIAREQGDYAEAKTWLEESLALARQSDDQDRVARTLIDLGLFDISLGQYAESRVRFAESLALYRTLDEQNGIAFALNRLGTASMMLGEYEQAERHLQRSLDLCRDLGDRRGTAGALANLGEAARLQEDYARARPYFEQALDVFREIGRQRGVIITLTNLGHVTSASNDEVTAAGYYRQALQIAWDIGLIPSVLDATVGLARLLCGRSPERALELLGLVRHHPALMEETRLVLDPLLTDLCAQMAPEDASTILERGSCQDLEATVDALLNSAIA